MAWVLTLASSTLDFASLLSLHSQRSQYYLPANSSVDQEYQALFAAAPSTKFSSSVSTISLYFQNLQQRLISSSEKRIIEHIQRV